MSNFKKAMAAAMAASALVFGGMTASAGFQEYPIGDEQEDTVNHFGKLQVEFEHS